MERYKLFLVHIIAAFKIACIKKSLLISNTKNHRFINDLILVDRNQKLLLHVYFNTKTIYMIVEIVPNSHRRSYGLVNMIEYKVNI